MEFKLNRISDVGGRVFLPTCVRRYGLEVYLLLELQSDRTWRETAAAWSERGVLNRLYREATK